MVNSYKNHVIQITNYHINKGSSCYPDNNNSLCGV